MRPRCTFQDFFDDYLKELIGMGGEASRVVALVHVLEDDADSPSRQVEFCEWLANELFLCERCGHEFSGRRLEVRENDPVVCPACAKRAR
ncbi:MAG: hypothetical protein ACRD1X_22260 [Vicinamibacteria bacterium]